MIIVSRGILAIVLLCVVSEIGMSQENPTPPFDAVATEVRASQGDVAAMVQLGNAYWGGRGVTANMEKGRAWLDRAAAKGSLEAQVDLGMAYFSGTKMSKDRQLAAKYLLEAAQQQQVDTGMQSSQGLAQYFVALMYDKGEGLETSHDKAIQFLQMAANNGNAPAQYALAALYNDGAGGIAMDKPHACELFEKAADQGHVRAMHNAGYCYQVGIGGKKDDGKAIGYYTKAAEAGNSRAQYNLGILCGQLGQAEKAYFWLRVAESSGATETKSLIDTAKEHLTNAELQSAESDVSAWLDAHKDKKR